MLADYQASVDFLQAFRAQGFWVLTAVHPLDRKQIVTRSFATSEVEPCKAWLEKIGETHNIYFSVNPTREAMSKKALREDIECMEYLHVDLDQRPGEDFDEQRELNHLLLTEKLPTGVPEPTFVVDSGGGYWGFWKLDEPVQIGGNPAKYEDAKRYNLQLEILFDADNCSNVDRIARLPGTINRPNEKKIKAGRVESESSWLKKDGPTYPITDFMAAPLTQSETFEGGNSLVNISGNVERLNEVDDLPDTVSKSIKVTIVQGMDDTNEKMVAKHGDDRSQWLFWVCCELVRAEVSDDMIYSVITDPGFAISASVLDKGRGSERYAKRQIQRAKEHNLDPNLEELNSKHAVIGDIGGKCRIISETWDEAMRRACLSFQSFADFHNRYMHRSVDSFKQGKDGPIPIEIPLGNWWTKHRQRRNYDRVVFVPGREIEGAYNMWTGFACDARPGSCQLYLDHIQKVICSGNKEVFEYLLGWMARAVQKPDEQGHVAVVMQGSKGAGKGKFASWFGRLFGRHFVPLSNADHLVGKFNAHMRDCVVIFADEAFYAGDKKHESVLKTIVTEDMIMSEAKGYDAIPCRNYTHLIMASNDNWVVPAGGHERRFLMLKVSDDVKQDKRYFAAIDEEMEAGGLEALLHFLLNYDISEYEPRNVPITKALQEQKQYSMTFEQQWWFEKLQMGEIFEGEGWPQYIVKKALVYDYVRTMGTWRSNARSTEMTIGRFLKEILPESTEQVRLSQTVTIQDERGQELEISRPRAYEIESLQACRDHWVSLYGETDWMEPAPLIELPEGYGEAL